MKEKKDKKIKNIFNESDKQKELRKIDMEQKNYKPRVEDTILDNNIFKENSFIDDTENMFAVDFSDILNVIDDLQNKQMLKDKELKKDKFSKNLSKIIGNVLQSKRIKFGFSQEDISEKTKTSRSHLSDIESGKIDISISTFFIISNALKINPSTLINEINMKLTNSKEDIINKEEIKEEINISENNDIKFIKNIVVQIGFLKNMYTTLYETPKGKKIIIPNNDFNFYKKKYGNDIFFLLDKKEENVILSIPHGKTNLKFPVKSTNDNIETSLPYR